MLSPDSLQTNIAAFLAPWPRLCLSQHETFCLTPGGNTPITGPAHCGHHPHPGLRHQAMQYADPPVTPGPRVFVLAVYTPSTSSSTRPGVRNIRDSVSQTSGHHVRGTLGQGVTLRRQRQWLPGAGNVS